MADRKFQIELISDHKIMNFSMSYELAEELLKEHDAGITDGFTDYFMESMREAMVPYEKRLVEIFNEGGEDDTTNGDPGAERVDTGDTGHDPQCGWAQ